MLRTLSWVVRFIVFLLALGLAIKNSGLVTLHFFFSSGWEMPLVLVMLVCFGIGALTGATASLATLYRQRREIDRLKDLLKRETEASAPPSGPVAPLPDITAI